jgi:hypothetical protein
LPDNINGHAKVGIKLMGNSKGDAINSETMNEENKTKKLFCLRGCEK